MSAYGCFTCFAFASGPWERLFNMIHIIFQIGWNMWKLHTDTWKNHSILVELLSTESTSQATSNHVETTSSQKNTCETQTLLWVPHSSQKLTWNQEQNDASLKLFESLGYRFEKRVEIFQEIHYMPDAKRTKRRFLDLRIQKLWHSIPSNQWISECWEPLLSSSLSILRFDAEIHEPFVLEELSEDFVSKKKHTSKRHSLAMSKVLKLLRFHLTRISGAKNCLQDWALDTLKKVSGKLYLLCCVSVLLLIHKTLQ